MIWIERTGLSCPVGLGTESACLAMRADISALAELPYRNDGGQPIVGARVELFPIEVAASERLTELLASAVEDCLPSDSPPSGAPPIAILLVWPGSQRVATPDLVERLSVVAASAAGLLPTPAVVTPVAGGPTAGFRVLEQAGDILRRRPGSRVVVCGVDSMVCASALASLARSGRLKTPFNPDGVVPGEGAACVLLTDRAPPHSGAVEIAGIGFGVEHATVLNDEPLEGLGLLAAVQSALGNATVALDDIGVRVCDAAGESYAFHEQSLVAARLLRRRKETLALWHPAEHIGHLGTAAGVAEVVVAAAALRAGWVSAPTALCTVGDDDGARAAVVLRRGIA